MTRNVLKRMKNKFSIFCDSFMVFDFVHNIQSVFNRQKLKSENLFFIRFRTLRVILDQKIKTALFVSAYRQLEQDP